MKKPILTYNTFKIFVFCIFVTNCIFLFQNYSQSGFNSQSSTSLNSLISKNDTPANTCTALTTKIDCSENNGTGYKLCNSTGTGFGACQLNKCNNGYTLQNQMCVVAVNSEKRDPLLQPFSSTSIWNMPIGSQAIYVAANIPEG